MSLSWVFLFLKKCLWVSGASWEVAWGREGCLSPCVMKSTYSLYCSSYSDVLYLVCFIWGPVSLVRHPSCVQRRVSGVQRSASGVRRLLSGVPCPASVVCRLASAVGRPYNRHSLIYLGMLKRNCPRKQLGFKSGYQSHLLFLQKYILQNNSENGGPGWRAAGCRLALKPSTKWAVKSSSIELFVNW